MESLDILYIIFPVALRIYVRPLGNTTPWNSATWLPLGVSLFTRMHMVH
jgi:hypothetical protein